MFFSIILAWVTTLDFCVVEMTPINILWVVAFLVPVELNAVTQIFALNGVVSSFVNNSSIAEFRFTVYAAGLLHKTLSMNLKAMPGLRFLATLLITGIEILLTVVDACNNPGLLGMLKCALAMGIGLIRILPLLCWFNLSSKDVKVSSAETLGLFLRNSLTRFLLSGEQSPMSIGAVAATAATTTYVTESMLHVLKPLADCKVRRPTERFVLALDCFRYLPLCRLLLIAISCSSRSTASIMWWLLVLGIVAWYRSRTALVLDLHLWLHTILRPVQVVHATACMTERATAAVAPLVNATACMTNGVTTVITRVRSSSAYAWRRMWIPYNAVIQRWEDQRRRNLRNEKLKAFFDRKNDRKNDRDLSRSFIQWWRQSKRILHKKMALEAATVARNCTSNSHQADVAAGQGRIRTALRNFAENKDQRSEKSFTNLVSNTTRSFVNGAVAVGVVGVGVVGVGVWMLSCITAAQHSTVQRRERKRNSRTSSSGS